MVEFVARIPRRWMLRQIRKTFELCHAGPVVITTRGHDTHVLMTEIDWLALAGKAEFADEKGD
jgi:hypothetical protein